MTTPRDAVYGGYRYPVELISYAAAKREIMPGVESSIGSTRASTTGRRIPTNRRDDESGS